MVPNAWSAEAEARASFFQDTFSGEVIGVDGVETTITADLPRSSMALQDTIFACRARFRVVGGAPWQRDRERASRESSHDLAVQLGKSRDPGGDAVAAGNRADAGRRAGEDEVAGLEFHQAREPGE